MVERTNRFAMPLRLPDDHGPLAVQEAIVAKIAQLPTTLRKTLTWDQGREMANHMAIAEAAQLNTRPWKTPAEALGELLSNPSTPAAVASTA